MVVTLAEPVWWRLAQAAWLECQFVQVKKCLDDLAEEAQMLGMWGLLRLLLIEQQLLQRFRYSRPAR